MKNKISKILGYFLGFMFTALVLTRFVLAVVSSEKDQAIAETLQFNNAIQQQAETLYFLMDQQTKACDLAKAYKKKDGEEVQSETCSKPDVKTILGF